MTTAVTEAIFRATYPEFKSTVTYPQSQVTYYLGLADKMLVNPLRWGNIRDDGIMLFMAHYMTLEQQAQQASKSGAVPGLSTGPMASKGVGPVNASYDTQAAIELGAGHWNNTTYGTRFVNLARMVGTGGIQV